MDIKVGGLYRMNCNPGCGSVNSQRWATQIVRITQIDDNNYLRYAVYENIDNANRGVCPDSCSGCIEIHHLIPVDGIDTTKAIKNMNKDADTLALEEAGLLNVDTDVLTKDGETLLQYILFQKHKKQLTEAARLLLEK